MTEKSKAEVCLLTMSPSEKDKRTFKEAELLADYGLHVIILGPKSREQKEREQRDGIEIIRVPFSPKPWQRKHWLLKIIERKFRRPIYFIKLLRAARHLDCDYYHAHRPLFLVIIAKLCATTTHGIFFGDFNDIINRKVAMDERRNPVGESDLLYYEQKNIWGKPPNEIDLARISTIRKLIPQDVRSILDAGCGDGKITNELARSSNFTVTGFDMSEEALSYVTTPKFRASIDSIPVPDQSYDLIICTEVLEHLPPAVYKKALQELSRISKKYILIELPYRQQLAFGIERCSSCGTKFHCNHHYRAFNDRILRRLFRRDWKMVEIHVVGGPQFYYQPFSLFIRQRLGGVWMKSPIAICTKCGAPQFVTGYRERNAISALCEDKNIKWRRNKKVILSQVIALYKRKFL